MAKSIKISIADALLKLVSETSEEKADKIYVLFRESLKENIDSNDFVKNISIPGKYKHLLIKD